MVDVKTFLISIVLVLALDLLWLGVIAGSLYKTDLRPILRMNGGSFDPRWAAVVPVYLLLALGFSVFVVPNASSVSQAAGLGALLGLIIYGVYDATNFALLSQWTLRITVIDTVWGAVLGAIASAGTYYLHTL